MSRSQKRTAWRAGGQTSKPRPPSALSINSGSANHGVNDMKVVELVPGKRVKWQGVDGAKEWIGAELTFDLKEESGVTVVLFGQRGWKEPVEFMRFCSTKWATYLLSLKSLCETGTGTPYPDDVDIG
jgi:activator of Hsp90 ATPase-like protein